MRVKREDVELIDGFQKEKDKFYLLTLIITGEENVIYSNKKDYIMARAVIGMPTWIWTNDNLSDESYQELIKDLKELMIKEENNQMTCKKELYDRLAKDFKVKDYFEMGYLSCDKLIKPREKKGIFVRASYKDKMILADYFQKDAKETRNKELALNDALGDVDLWIKGRRFYCLVDSKGKIVSMAGYSILGNTAKITHVYTPVEERNKSYCTNLIYELTKLLDNEGLKPILYTDYNYEPSNKSYKKVGYKDEGILINFTIEN